uniref:G_PROTEIN_RECEP_F1_2 domain-containing protein n=1 Tax=Rhabditophanes sp. KR3021 TaxID=114890 RepID=A0AC35UEA7_9BILA
MNGLKAIVKIRMFNIVLTIIAALFIIIGPIHCTKTIGFTSSTSCKAVYVIFDWDQYGIWGQVFIILFPLGTSLFTYFVNEQRNCSQLIHQPSKQIMRVLGATVGYIICAAMEFVYASAFLSPPSYPNELDEVSVFNVGWYVAAFIYALVSILSICDVIWVKDTSDKMCCNY